MSTRYRLPCEKCGRVRPVEPGQAGGSISCECGNNVIIPSMLKIKRLEPWESDDAPEEELQSAPSAGAPEEKKESELTTSSGGTAADAVKLVQKNAEESAEKKRRLSPRRRGLFFVASFVFIVSVFFVGRAIPAPPPQAIFYKQVNYELGDGRKVRRDTTPITMDDYNFYFFTDYSDPERRTYLVNDALIDRMNYFVCSQYFQAVKQLDMSDNFYDNYEALKTKRLLFLTGFGTLAIVSLVFALFALFAKEKVSQVGSMRGENWK